MNSHTEKLWNDFFDPEITRKRILNISVYITTFEILKTTVEEHLYYFFWNGFKNEKDILSPEYKKYLKKNRKSKAYAGLDFLKANKAINDKDIASFTSCKKQRNEFVHEMFAKLSQELPENFSQNFSDMVDLLYKIELWWFKNIEMSINTDIAWNQTNINDIIPSSIAQITMLKDIALGDEQKSKAYQHEYAKHTQNTDK